MRIQRLWYDRVAKAIKCPLVQVETNVVAPVESVTDREEYAAHTIRPKIWKLAPNFLRSLDAVLLENPNCEVRASFKLPEQCSVNDNKILFQIPELESFKEFDINNVSEAVNRLDQIDHSVQPVNTLIGGYRNARKMLDEFLKDKLAGYNEGRNQMGQDFQSYMSAYLHYGHISPVEIILSIQDSNAPKASKDAYIEELLIRRELR